MVKFYAHSSSEVPKSEWHLLKDHLNGTALLAEAFASSFNANKLGYLIGLIHDIGKYSDYFQRRLEGDKRRVDHSTAGALEVNDHYSQLGRILAYTIAGHHCGLPDWGSKASEASLEARLLNRCLPEYSSYSSEITLPNQKGLMFPIRQAPVGQGFSVQFLIRFLFSALVDADFLDTERALNPRNSSLRENTNAHLSKLLPALQAFLQRKSETAPATPINIRRSQILANCDVKAACPPGLFTLTVPTGGGKTLSSMLFALKHALLHVMNRVVYVIPYTSIIEQNAAVFKGIFGEDSVLEHHSSFSYPGEASEDSEAEHDPEIWERMKLTSQNWDAPIITTTNVQFFESLFAAKSSRCRKLHNIANSVVILDEAQVIPTGFLKPCINALVELVTNYNATVVLCTATQPSLNKLLPPSVKTVEIVDNPEELYKSFQRVSVNKLGSVSDDDLVERLLQHDQVLCIVNSKKHARVIFEKLQDDEALHLSTRMCPAHRSKILQAIRSKLSNGQPCRVVSTQLIEAGVDVDFPVVYRSSAGIDSIAQSAGRCNREGLRDTGIVYVFEPEKHGLPAGWLSRTASIGRGVLRRHKDPIGLEGVKDYFTELYDIEGEQLDKEQIMGLITEQQGSLKFPFRTIASKFKLIDDQGTTGIVIPWNDECRATINAIRLGQHQGQYLRNLQKYTVQVYENELKDMVQLGIVEDVGRQFYSLTQDSFKTKYSPKLGLLPCTQNMLLSDTLVI